MILKKIHISIISVSFNEDLWFASWLTHTFKIQHWGHTFKPSWKNVWIHPDIFQHFPSWKTVITRLQELFVKGDAVKFLWKKSKNRSFISPQMHPIYLFYTIMGSIVPAGRPRAMIPMPRNPNGWRAMQVTNLERYWCLVWPHPNTSLFAKEASSFFPCLLNFHGHVNSTVIVAT